MKKLSPRTVLAYLSSCKTIGVRCMKTAFAIAAGLLWGGYAFASPCETEIARVIKSASSVEKVMQKIENPPPDVRKYLDDEKSAAMEQGSAARLQLLMANPSYYAHTTLSEFENFKSILNAFKVVDTPRHQAIQGVSLIHRITELQTSFSEYLDFDSRRSLRVFSYESGRGAWTVLSIQRSFTSVATTCLIGAIQ